MTRAYPQEAELNTRLYTMPSGTPEGIVYTKQKMEHE